MTEYCLAHPDSWQQVRVCRQPRPGGMRTALLWGYEHLSYWFFRGTYRYFRETDKSVTYYARRARWNVLADYHRNPFTWLLLPLRWGWCH